ncbi:MAG: hypothetical protein VYB25_00415, partial [Pseudomonadota bacterium]|nr:hypothetical protein [Pseudomonadota bacterium]
PASASSAADNSAKVALVLVGDAVRLDAGIDDWAGLAVVIGVSPRAGAGLVVVLAQALSSKARKIDAMR